MAENIREGELTQALSTDVKMQGLTETMSVGKILAQSGFFADSKDAAQAITKILAGQELGLGPVASMTGIYIVKGRVTLSANIMASIIKRSGRYSYRIKRLDDTGCVLVFTDGGKDLTPEISFTEADAKKAELLAGDNWKKYPRNMMFARALSNGAKWHCPDVFGQPVYTPEELGGNITIVDMETGEIIDAPKDAPQPAEAPSASPEPHDDGSLGAVVARGRDTTPASQAGTIPFPLSMMLELGYGNESAAKAALAKKAAGYFHILDWDALNDSQRSRVLVDVTSAYNKKIGKQLDAQAAKEGGE